MSEKWFSVGFTPSTTPTYVPGQVQVKDWAPRRFWLNPGETKDIVFVDDTVFKVREHNPKINGKWDNYFTCLQGTGEECPICQVLGPKSSYEVGYYTVVDCSEYTDKKGVKHQYELKYFPAKTKTLKKFHMKKEKQTTLVGCKFTVSRVDKKSPQVGDDFDLSEKLDVNSLADVVTLWGSNLSALYSVADSDKEQMAKLRKVLDLTLNKEKTVKTKVPVFNYYVQLKPKSVAELRELTKGMEVDTNTAPAQVEEVPF